MRVLLYTNAGWEVGSAREWFYQMHDYLTERGIDSSLNSFDRDQFDIAIILRNEKDLIRKVLEHSPHAHVGVLNPGSLGFTNTLTPELTDMVNNVDFFLVVGFMWTELLLPFHRRVYEVIDYDIPVGKLVKQHSGSDDLVIGYHGNPLHYANDFFPYGANALKRLSREHKVTLKVVTNNVKKLPKVEGVETEFIEWELETYKNHLQTFDIGVCPSFSTLAQISDPLVHIRNPNRINTLLFYGIPSVASPIPQSCQILRHDETVLFAATEEGWYHSMKRLVIDHELRNRIGGNGRKMVEQEFSHTVAVEKFIKMIRSELDQPLFPKKGYTSFSGRGSSFQRRLTKIFQKLAGFLK